jgi:small ligand-binding sensory domain FIST
VAEQAKAVVPTPELGLVFFSPHHLRAMEEQTPEFCKTLGVRTLLGSVGETIVGGPREVEQGPAISLWLAGWDGRIAIDPFHMTVTHTPDGWSLLGWPDALLEADPAASLIITLGDPYTFPADQLFLPRIHEDRPGLRVIGGMASGMSGPGATRLVRDGRLVDEGAVGVLLRGLKARTVVSQGCRPIGKPMIVTKVDGTLVTGLGGKTPLEQLRELWPQLPQRDQELFRRGPHLGVVINEYQEKFERGDFLVRNIAGLDPESGAVAVMDHLRVGQTVQFHVRDAATADEDLIELLRRNRQPAAGGLLFTCNGRGTRLFPEPDHDAATVCREAGPLPLAGFFAAGEMGPIGGRNFLHGFTASVVLFDE